MNLLLDSHAFLWFCLGDTRLSKAALQALSAAGARRWISIASLWELNIKASLGKLILHRPLAFVTDDAFQRQGFRLLPIELAHLEALRQLPLHHRDPFDRMLIAQFDSYGVTRLW